MECFGFEDCGPKLREALVKHFGHDEIAAREVQDFNRQGLSSCPFASRVRPLEDKARSLLFVAMAARQERGKALLALVGDALVKETLFPQDVIIIPAILSEWLTRMADFSPIP